VEATLIVFMLLGGTSFLVHWNLVRGRFRRVAADRELRLWLALILGMAVIAVLRPGPETAAWPERLRTSLFHVVSIATTTGYTTQDLGSAAFSTVTQQLFLWMMVIGGCVGSTAGGFKVWRVLLLSRVMGQQAKRSVLPGSAVVPLTLGGQRVPREEVVRAATVLFGWIGLVAISAIVLNLSSTLSVVEALSGGLSVVGNVGPSLIDTAAFERLGVAAKLWMMVAMIAGRLEILPVLLLIQRRAWR
jgi:trk system potassium uptake protein TrkH